MALAVNDLSIQISELLMDSQKIFVVFAIIGRPLLKMSLLE